MENYQFKKSTIELSFKGEQIAIHRFARQQARATPILLIHGSIENGRIFYSSSGKGLAPYLASEGFDVFVADLRGRGGSKPPVSAKSKASQTDTISEELPAIINKVQELSGSSAIHLGAHSWGGVMLLASYALFHEEMNVRSMVFLGSKRHISIFNLNRFFNIDLGWSILGPILTAIHGYFPAKIYGAGADNEPRVFNRQVRTWVYQKEWIDPETGFDYAEDIRNIQLPPIFFFAGVKDPYLGHPQDVQRLAEECGVPDSVTMLGKRHGNLHDYGHIDMLTHPDAVKDHFPGIAEIFRQHS